MAGKTSGEALKTACCRDLTQVCHSTRCMAWRWSREKETAAYLDDVQAYMIETGTTNFGAASQKVWADKAGSYRMTEGYCGLAGKPE